jgi:hypothetical protein
MSSKTLPDLERELRHGATAEALGAEDRERLGYSEIEPPKASPDGFLSKQWTRWEHRQAEARLDKPDAGPREALIAEWDTTIEKARQLTEEAALAKSVIAKELEAAKERQTVYGSGGRVDYVRPDRMQIGLLIAKLNAAAVLLESCKSTEVEARVARNEFAARKVRWAPAREPDDEPPDTLRNVS